MDEVPNRAVTSTSGICLLDVTHSGDKKAGGCVSYEVINELLFLFMASTLLAPCSFALSATSQHYFSLKTNQPSPISQQYFFLGTNQYQPPATSRTNWPSKPSILL
jgi:hypothetical protein